MLQATSNFLVIVLLSLLQGAFADELIVDLGKWGNYKGIEQNNGSVHSWKGIPYAQPPIGPLRFKAPRPLDLSSSEQHKVVDVTDDALRCVQFAAQGSPSIFGVKMGPGVEDCLKLWIWKPARPKFSTLPVLISIHGGALQRNTAANDDFSDWVSKEQNFIAVNMDYRLGALGFMASDELTKEGEPANAGILDMQLALKWVQENIGKFGGDPNQVTIVGQSGGGYAVINLLLYNYNKTNVPFQKAIARSNQRSPVYTIEELQHRNNKFAQELNCTSDLTQLECFRRASTEALVNASLSLEKSFENMESTGFLPTIDSITLNDSPTKLIKAGKFVKVPLIASYVSHEAAIQIGPEVELNYTTLDYNLSSSDQQFALSLYPVNETFGTPDNTGAYFDSGYFAALQTARTFGENGMSGSETLLARYFSKFSDPTKVWSFHFNAPELGTDYGNNMYPLGPVIHCAENLYLTNVTELMRPFERALAKELRAYLGSFIRTGNPNNEKVISSKEWLHYTATGETSPVRLVPAFDPHATVDTDDDITTGTGLEILPEAQRRRIDFWLSDKVLDQTRV